MKNIVKIDIETFKGFSIITEEGIQYGIFFRSPIQKVEFDAYYADIPETSAYIFQKKIKNPIRRAYEILIGNYEPVKNISKWLDVEDFAGFVGNKLMSPIYFKRNYRRLIATNEKSNNAINKVESYGYEGPYNRCSGACHIERTKITLRNGTIMKKVTKKQYHYTYEHIVEGMIKDGIID